MGGKSGLHRLAWGRTALLHPYLHRPRPAFGYAGLPPIVFVGHLPVVFLRYGLSVPEPLAYLVLRPPIRNQLRRPRGPDVLKQLWPRRQPGPVDDPLKLGSEVRLPASESMYSFVFSIAFFSCAGWVIEREQTNEVGRQNARKRHCQRRQAFAITFQPDGGTEKNETRARGEAQRGRKAGRRGWMGPRATDRPGLQGPPRSPPGPPAVDWRLPQPAEPGRFAAPKTAPLALPPDFP